MLRAAGLVLVLLAAPIAGLTLLGGDGSGEDAAVPTAVPGNDRAVHDVDLAQSVPEGTGWAVLEVRANASTTVRASLDVLLRPQDNRTAGAVGFLAGRAEDGSPQVSFAGGTTHGRSGVEAHHQGTSLACCPDDPAPGGVDAAVGDALPVGPERPAFVGVVLVNASSQSSAHVQLIHSPSRDANGTQIHLDQPRSGSTARAVDLVQNARRNGTHARAGGLAVTRPGTAHVDLDADRGALAFLQHDIARGASADVDVRLPNGIPLDDPAPPGTSGHLFALGGPGLATHRLTNLTATEPDREPFQRPRVDAQLILADVPVPIEAVDREVRPHGASADFIGPGSRTAEVEVTDEHLPGETGWFWVEIRSGTSSPVHLETNFSFTPSRDEVDAAVPIVADVHHLRARADGSGDERTTQVHAENRSLRTGCCQQLEEQARDGAGVYSAWHGIQPGEPIVVGLAADGWGPKDSLTIHVDATRANLTVGDVHRGTQASAVDLFGEAAKEGSPTVQSGSDRPVGDLDDTSVSWTVDEGGLLALTWDLEEAEADLAARLPNGTSRGSQLHTETVGHVEATTGPGELAVSIANASRSGQHEGQAIALGADLDLPYERLEFTERRS